MIGDEQHGMDGAQSGICARALKDVFREISRRRVTGTTTTVEVCMRGRYDEAHLIESCVYADFFDIFFVALEQSSPDAVLCMSFSARLS